MRKPNISLDELAVTLAEQTVQIRRLIESVERLVAVLTPPSVKQERQHEPLPFGAPTPGASRPPALRDNPASVPFAPQPRGPLVATRLIESMDQLVAELAAEAAERPRQHESLPFSAPDDGSPPRPASIHDDPESAPFCAMKRGENRPAEARH